MAYSAVPTRTSASGVPSSTDVNQLQSNITAILNGVAPWNAVTPGTPPSGKYYLYFKTDGKLYKKNDAGTEAEIG